MKLAKILKTLDCTAIEFYQFVGSAAATWGAISERVLEITPSMTKHEMIEIVLQHDHIANHGAATPRTIELVAAAQKDVAKHDAMVEALKNIFEAEN